MKVWKIRNPETGLYYRGYKYLGSHWTKNGKVYLRRCDVSSVLNNNFKEPYEVVEYELTEINRYKEW